MRGLVLATFAALLGSTMADGLHGRGGHDSFHKRRAVQQGSSNTADQQVCGLTTTVTFYGPPVVVTPSAPAPAPESTTTTSTSTTPSSTLTTPSSSSTSTSRRTSTVHTTAYTTVTVSVTPKPTSSPASPSQPTTTPQESSSPASPEQPSTTPKTSSSYVPPPPAPEQSTTTPAPAPPQPATTSEASTSVPAPAPSSPSISSSSSSEPASTSSSPAPISTTSAVSSAPATSSVPETTTSITPSSSSSSSSSSAATPSSTGKIGGKRFAVTYSPYNNNGGCKDKSDVLSDVAVAKEKGFSAVRIYSTDCNGLENVGAAAKQHGLKIIAGVYISQSGVSKAQEQVDALAKWAQWDLVNLIVVGNEAIQSGYIDAGSLASFIQSSKSSFKKAGYNGEVTTTEPLDIWQKDGNTLCGAVDSVGANLHPFYNAQVTAAEAGKFVQDELKILGGICPGKQTYNLETGWPNAGDANGQAVPGLAEQLIAVKAIDLAAGDKSVFFSYSDDSWKPAGQFNVEKHWGCIKAFI